MCVGYLDVLHQASTLQLFWALGSEISVVRFCHIGWSASKSYTTMLKVQAHSWTDWPTHTCMIRQWKLVLVLETAWHAKSSPNVSHQNSWWEKKMQFKWIRLNLTLVQRAATWELRWAAKTWRITTHYQKAVRQIIIIIPYLLEIMSYDLEMMESVLILRSYLFITWFDKQNVMGSDSMVCPVSDQFAVDQGWISFEV